MHTVDTKKPAIKQVFYLIDPFEVREVLQVENTRVEKSPAESQSLWSQGGAASKQAAKGLRLAVSQSLWSQGGAARSSLTIHARGRSLNPFEVREVLQVLGLRRQIHPLCLNPFEVRKVLQG